MDDFINKFNKLLAQKGATDRALQEFNQSAIAQMNNLKSNIETAFAQAGERGLEILKPLLCRINEGFKNGSFEGLFNAINIGLTGIVNGVMIVVDIISFTCDLIQNNWGIIEPILIGIAVYISAILIPVIWDAITTIAAMGIAWIMVNWPILLIIGAISLFIFILKKCGITTEQICGFIGGSFGVLWASIYNGVAFVWNHIASFAEFF